jgi:hypothetical protein
MRNECPSKQLELVQKKNTKQGDGLLTVTCFKWGKSSLYTTVGAPYFRSKEMGIKQFQVLHHSHILSFLNANNISNEYTTTMYLFQQRPHGENQTP